AFAPIPVVDRVAGARFRTGVLLAEQRSSGEREVFIWPEFVFPILRHLLRHMVLHRSRSYADRIFLASMTHLIIEYSGEPNCCTSTRCPQFLGVWRREEGSARRSEGGES